MFLKNFQKRLQELSACSCYNNNYSQLVCVECRMLVFEKVLPKGTFFCVQSSELETGLLSRHPETFSFFNHCVIEERERKNHNHGQWTWCGERHFGHRAIHL